MRGRKCASRQKYRTLEEIAFTLAAQLPIAPKKNAFVYDECASGAYQDKETNLHYNYFRDYDSGIGRYVQSDPIGLRGGPNTYLYGKADPLRFIDPTGEMAGAAVIVGGSALVVAAAIYISSPAGKNGIKSIIKTIENACSAANDDDDIDCEEWLRLLNDEYDQITKLDQAGGDMRLMKKQHNRSVALFCKVCAYLCHKAKSF